MLRSEGSAAGSGKGLGRGLVRPPVAVPSGEVPVGHSEASPLSRASHSLLARH